ncbi:MAG TPA: choice-of-anchor D domain-containing protein, partial [Vicinamibacterales bacterium]|nr:choice-of-anchor D domain-containing protein [Vicinamibacterales bacterium]
SVTQVVRFSPTASGPASGSLSVTPNTGQGAISVALSGSGATASDPPFLTVSPSSVAFGSVTVGSSATASVVLTNTGDSNLTLSAVTLPGAPFSAVAPVVGVGTVVPANGSVTQVVRFSPTASGPASGSLSVTPNTGQGAISVALSGSGATATGCADTLPAVTATGWQRNGTATVSGTGVQLTPPTSFSAGTVIYTTPLPSAGLRVCFDAEIGGGTGADGMTLMLLNPSAGAGALGDDGSGLGYGTLPGLAVALDTFDSGTADPSGNFVGIANGGNARGLTWLSTSTAIPTLENAGPVPVEVQVVSGRLQVKVAGSQVLDTAVSLPSQVLLGFSAGTGGQADRHIVRNVRVGGATASDPPFLTVSPSSVAFV